MEDAAVVTGEVNQPLDVLAANTSPNVNANVPVPSVHGSLPISQATLGVSLLPGKTLNSSGDDLDSLIRTSEHHVRHLSDLVGSCSSFVKRFERIAELREAILLGRSSMIHLRERIRNHSKFVEDSQKSFLDEVERIVTIHSDDSTTERLRAFHTQTSRDSRRYVEAEQNLRQSEEEIGNLEFTLQHLEYKQQQTIVAISRIVGEMALPITIESESLSNSVQESDMDFPVLVQHYFDKAGDVAVERDWLVNLEDEYRDARTDRIHRTDQGRPPPLTDEEFEITFQKERTYAERKLDEAIRKAELARAVCVGEGLDPEVFRKARSRHSQYSTVSAAANGTPPELWTSVHGPAQGAPPPTSSTRVEEWIQSVEPPDSQLPDKKRSKSEGQLIGRPLELLLDGTLRLAMKTESYATLQTRADGISTHEAHIRPPCIERSFSDTEVHVHDRLASAVTADAALRI